MHFAAEEPPSAFVVVQSVMMMPAKPHSFLAAVPQIVAVGGVDTVYLVVGGHDRLWLGFLDCNFEALQVNLTQGALGNDARYAAAVFFLIVAGVMFDGRSDPVLSLHTACESCCDDSDQNFD